ncbi:MAG: deoxyribodipyrimidine photo-lyase [Xanthomonadales bacterium]|nr:DNA photolyase family protein [Gammaproteobacteria bacterium]NNE06096.1 deoxyribodipyrimidine photo-lyase [Xanthomonadales bacterium]NNL96505.1 deoxyribodipyrimidine photo-lyase [Xanthomonadales bacterium]
MTTTAIVWFRKDLRLQDNPAFAAAVNAGHAVVPLFVHAPDEEGDWAPGAASNWWLHHALDSLDLALEKAGLALVIRKGPSLEALREVAKTTSAEIVYWNRRYEPAVIERDKRIKSQLCEDGLEVRSFNASLLFEPHEIKNKSGEPFKVFTPFWKHLRKQSIPEPVSVDLEKVVRPENSPGSIKLDELRLLPEIDWDTGFSEHWKPTLGGARQTLDEFIEQWIASYKDKRDLPATPATSQLSPYLHAGQIGPRQVWRAVQEAGAEDSKGGFTFLSEVAWREFAYHLLYHFPETPDQALQPAYRKFPFEPDPDHLEAWQKGQTGYPLVDAGMRQLWHIGWMHNRVRMVVASLLVKHQLQPWQDGARWFWDTLVDADLASNTMGWQWTAGCGADAAPYFRIFNPMLQGKKFDPEGNYVRKWVPELGKLPSKYIHEPWEAPADVLKEAGVELGQDYPQPVIGHREGRQRALDALSRNKEQNAQS